MDINIPPKILTVFVHFGLLAGLFDWLSSFIVFCRQLRTVKKKSLDANALGLTRDNHKCVHFIVFQVKCCPKYAKKCSIRGNFTWHNIKCASSRCVFGCSLWEIVRSLPLLTSVEKSWRRSNKEFFSTNKTKEKLEGKKKYIAILLPSNFSFVLLVEKNSLLHLWYSRRGEFFLIWRRRMAKVNQTSTASIAWDY